MPAREDKGSEPQKRPLISIRLAAPVSSFTLNSIIATPVQRSAPISRAA